ncbi:MAG: hypothetical protein LKM38_11110 [Pseudomonas veronii]|jgi:hypothetical protein|nr:hypothetical protein [Pseudomonas veronii]
MFFGADKAKIVSEALGALRYQAGSRPEGLRDLAKPGHRCGSSTSRCSKTNDDGKRFSALPPPVHQRRSARTDIELLKAEPGGRSVPGLRHGR